MMHPTIPRTGPPGVPVETDGIIFNSPSSPRILGADRYGGT